MSNRSANRILILSGILALSLGSALGSAQAAPPTLIEGVDYNFGNGRGAPVAEAVAGYAHKDEALNHFTERRVQAVSRYFNAQQTNYERAHQIKIDGNFQMGAGIIDLDYLKRMNYPQLSMHPGYTQGDGEKIKFLTRSGLEKCQVFLINQHFYQYNESGALVLYNSEPAALDGVTGDIIVMDPKGNIFIFPKEMGKIHHSTFFSQKPIAFGAMVRIKDGVLVNSAGERDTLDAVDLFPQRVRGQDYPRGLMYYSGHYDPHTGSQQVREQCKAEALDAFKEQLELVHSVGDLGLFDSGTHVATLKQNLKNPNPSGFATLGDAYRVKDPEGKVPDFILTTNSKKKMTQPDGVKFCQSLGGTLPTQEQYEALVRASAKDAGGRYNWNRIPGMMGFKNTSDSNYFQPRVRQPGLWFWEILWADFPNLFWTSTKTKSYESLFFAGWGNFNSQYDDYELEVRCAKPAR